VGDDKVSVKAVSCPSGRGGSNTIPRRLTRRRVQRRLQLHRQGSRGQRVELRRLRPVGRPRLIRPSEARSSDAVVRLAHDLRGRANRHMWAVHSQVRIGSHRAAVRGQVGS
jgi:hypothetical protein